MSVVATKTGFQDYYNVFKGYELFTAEEERALLKRIRKGDKDAREKFICHNMRLVLSCVLRFCSVDDPRAMDLASAGTLGLLKAIDDFDTSSFDNRFSTYAVWWIQAKIRKEINALSPKAVRFKTLNTRYRTARKKLQEELQRPPTNEEIFKELKWSALTIQKFLDDQKKKIISLEKIELASESGELKNDPLASDHENVTLEELMHIESVDRLNSALARLSPMHEDILRRHYGCGHPTTETYDQLASFYNYTRERIRQIENKALRMLWVILREDNK